MDTSPRRPQGETRALVLRYYRKGLYIKDIAAKCDISVQAVSAHVRRLREDGDLVGRRVP